jgi:hypothetical protein
VKTLKEGKSHDWVATDKYSTLALNWARGVQDGNGKVNVTIGKATTEYKVPQANIAVSQQAGKMVNNTDKTIEYTLS